MEHIDRKKYDIIVCTSQSRDDLPASILVLPRTDDRNKTGDGIWNQKDPVLILQLWMVHDSYEEDQNT